MSRVERTKSKLVHQIAACNDCDWREEWFKTASRKARKHSSNTGHTTWVETGTTYTYEVKS